MNHGRALFRLTGLVAVSLFFIALRMAVWPGALWSRRRDRARRRFLLQHWAWCFARIAGMKVTVEGTPPAPPFYLVCNHVTYLDMLILAHQTGSIFVSREDVQHWPFFGFVAKSLYILFIDRQNLRDTARVNALIAETLAEGDGIVVFPESRVTCGITVDPFKSALLQSAASLRMPVHYAAISYRTPEGAPTEGALVSWWRPEPFYTHLYRFVAYPGATATLRFGATPILSEDRKELARRLHQGVLSCFTPLRQAAIEMAGDLMPVETDSGSSPAEEEI